MTTCDWIICERHGHWAGAMRTTMERQSMKESRHLPQSGARFSVVTPNFRPRLQEVRTLNQLREALAAQPRAMVFIEVLQESLAMTLAWLSESSQVHPDARFVALCAESEFNRLTASEAAAALRAAGAVEISRSLRDLQHLLAIGRRHAQLLAEKARDTNGEGSFAEWASALLPFQPAGGELR